VCVCESLYIYIYIYMNYIYTDTNTHTHTHMCIYNIIIYMYIIYIYIYICIYIFEQLDTTNIKLDNGTQIAIKTIVIGNAIISMVFCVSLLSLKLRVSRCDRQKMAGRRTHTHI
jgi:hypothetical protein